MLPTALEGYIQAEGEDNFSADVKFQVIEA
jgi:hypothetical protein